MSAWVQWDQEIPGWLRYLWWSCCGGGLGMFGGVIWAFVAARADRAPDREMHAILHSMIGACVGALIGAAGGLLVAWLRRPRRSGSS